MRPRDDACRRRRPQPCSRSRPAAPPARREARHHPARPRARRQPTATQTRAMRSRTRMAAAAVGPTAKVRCRLAGSARLACAARLPAAAMQPCVAFAGGRCVVAYIDVPAAPTQCPAPRRPRRQARLRAVDARGRGRLLRRAAPAGGAEARKVPARDHGARAHQGLRAGGRAGRRGAPHLAWRLGLRPGRVRWAPPACLPAPAAAPAHIFLHSFTLLPATPTPPHHPQVRHYYYRLIKRLNKVLGEGGKGGDGKVLDPRNALAVHRAMLKFWDVVRRRALPSRHWLAGWMSPVATCRLLPSCC